MKIDKSYFLNQIDQYMKDNGLMRRYHVTIDFLSSRDFTIDANDEEEAKGYALDSFHDEFTIEEVEVVDVYIVEDTPNVE
jgi:hypothetical protein